jgi:SulP family sulfate permease
LIHNDEIDKKNHSCRKRYKVPTKIFFGGLVAGLVMALVSIPGGLAQGLLAGVNPLYGLYSMIAGTSVAALFTSSVIMNVDSTSATALATVIACIAVIEWAAREKAGAMSRPLQTMIRNLGAIGLILLAFLGGELSTPFFIAIVAGIMIVLVGLDISWRRRNPLTVQAEMT